MFKKKSSDKSDLEADDKMNRTVVTKSVETVGGVKTTTTTITASSKGEIDEAFKRFNFDPEKFKSGGTSVTKKIVYTSSSGQKEVLEETVETYDDPPIKNGSAKEVKTSKPFIEKLGLKFSKSSPSPKDSSGPNTATKATTASVKPGKFEDDCLKAHNVYRAKHGVPNLKLSKEICSYAKEWADHLAATDRFQHRSERKYGENIFMKWSSDHNHVVAGNEAVDSWYSEIKDHTFGREPTSTKSGHFTQVIWRDSKEMGVAWSKSKSGKILVVANYDPPGNFIGRYTENVPAPKK